MILCVVSLFPGHSLGMDIHDSMTLPKDKPLEPGVVSRSISPFPSYPSYLIYHPFSPCCVHALIESGIYTSTTAQLASVSGTITGPTVAHPHRIRITTTH